MARNRNIRDRKLRRGKPRTFEMDITSLLDILVILLVFLIRSYNTSGITVTVPEGIKLPMSKTQGQSEIGIQIQVSPTHIWVDNELVLDASSAQGKIYDRGGKRILPLYNKLVAKKQDIELLAKETRAKPFSGIASLVIDKTVKYNYLKKLMYTCAEAGFSKYKFMVQGEDI